MIKSPQTKQKHKKNHTNELILGKFFSLPMGCGEVILTP